MFPKGIIFDLDGVICSTDAYHYQAWKMLAERLSIPFNQQTNDLMRGSPAWRAWKFFCSNIQALL